MRKRRTILNRLPAPRLAWLLLAAELGMIGLMIVGIVHLLADLDPLMRAVAFEWLALLVLFSGVAVIAALIVRR